MMFGKKNELNYSDWQDKCEQLVKEKKHVPLFKFGITYTLRVKILIRLA
jgi:hypothetical protein